jgi:hypothetical protein
MLSLLLLSSVILDLTTALTSPLFSRQITHPPPASDPYANPDPSSWQSNVLCGPDDRSIGFDPDVTQGMTKLFCQDLLGYPVEASELSLPSREK